MPAPLTLEQAVTRYDMAQSTKRHYNHYALAIYLQRADEVMVEVAKGKPLRDAIIDGFTDRLRAYELKAMGLEPLP